MSGRRPSSWAPTLDPGALRELHLQHGRKALEGREPQRALVEAEEVLDSSPDDSSALWLAAEALFDLGDLESARMALGRLNRKARPSVEALSLAARVELELGVIDAAEELARRALDTRGGAAHDRAQSLFVRGVVGRLRGESAARWLEEAADLDPGCFAGPSAEDISMAPAALRRAWQALLPDERARLGGPPRVLDHPRLADLAEGMDSPLDLVAGPEGGLRVYLQNLGAFGGDEEAMARVLTEALRDRLPG